MVCTTARGACLAALLAWGISVPALFADDWLSGTMEAKPPQFRATRYDGEWPLDESPKAAAPKANRAAGASPAETVEAEPYYEKPIQETLGEDLSGFDAFLDDFGWSSASRVGVFTAGADYLNARPSFSEATAFARVENFTTNSRQELVQYDFGYSASPRVYVGYRRPDCQAELRFTYTQFAGQAHVASGAPVGDTVIILDPTLPICSCTEVNATANVNANIYDIDLLKSHCFPASCCADPCAPACPGWELTYWFGIRIADISWNSFGEVIDVGSQDLVATNDHRMNFAGAGPRVGLQARRFFGQQGRLSVFGRANLALLLGQYEIESAYYEAADDDTDTNLLRRDRVIPVTEIEVGLSYHFRKHTTVSAGYFMQAWHDLGMSQQITGQFPQGFDDANILSFDGLFVRGEWTF